MRFYRLTIGGRTFCELNKDNPSAIRLEFELQATLNAMIPNAIIKLHNLPSTYFTKQGFKSLIDQPLVLEAGLQKTPILEKMKIQPPKSNVILKGFIVNVVLNPVTLTGNEIQLFVNPSPTKQYKEKVLCQIKEGDSLKDKFKSVLSELYPQATIKVQGSTIASNFSENITFRGLGDLQQRAKQNNIMIFISKDGYTIGDTLTQPSDTITLKRTDFLENPMMEDVVTLRCALFVRGDIVIGTKLKIPDNLFSQSVGGVKMIGAKPSVLITGEYRVVNAWYKGDSRAIGKEAWALNIKAVKL